MEIELRRYPGDKFTARFDQLRADNIDESMSFVTEHVELHGDVLAVRRRPRVPHCRRSVQCAVRAYIEAIRRTSH